MPKKKADADADSAPEEETEKEDYYCKQCIENGVPQEKAHFTNFGIYMKHMRLHKAEARLGVAPNTVSGAAGAPGQAESADRREMEAAAAYVVRKKNIVDEVAEERMDEMDVLREILAQAGVIARRESIINSFTNKSPDDIGGLDQLLNMANVPYAARRMALQNWIDHRGLNTNYVDKKYPTGEINLPRNEEEERSVPVKQKDPMDAMMEMMEKQLKLQMMQIQMQSMQRALSQGMYVTADGRPIEMDKKVPEKEMKSRTLDDGSIVKMNDEDWTNYVIGQQNRKLQAEKLQAEKEAAEKKGTSEKIPFRMDDGTVVQVPADQVDKWLFLLNATSPDKKKDIYELIREQEKTRQEMERFYQQQMVQLKDQNYQMAMEQQARVIQQLQAQMSQRPSPIQEMVQTQTELKEAGLLADKTGKDVDTAKLEMQEKKLDTTMQLMIQQQQSLNRKTDQLVSALGPMMQQYAMKASENLPKPQEVREQFHERRAAIAREVLPTDVSTIEQIAAMDGQEPRPPARRKRVVGAAAGKAEE